MPIFYLDSGSIDNLEISSSLLVSGSLVVTGSMRATGGLTGSLFGTASFSVRTVTASYYELVTGSSGTDFNIVTTSSGSIINIPDASTTARGLVTTGNQTFTGIKTFNSQTVFNDSVSIYANNSNPSLALNAGSFITLTIENFRLFGIPTYFYLGIGGYTAAETLNANTNVSYIVLGNQTYTEATSGTHSIISALAIKQITLLQGGASTTNGASVYIEGPISGSAIIANNYALWIDSGSTRLDGNLIMSGSNILATGSISATAGFTGSLLGTASYAIQALSASWAPGGSVQVFPYTGSAIISGSLIVTGSFRTQPSGTEGGAIIGNVNNYLEFFVQNLNSGLSASTDIVAYNNTGNKTQNYVDMGINSSGIAGDYSFGKANDAYVYNTGGDLFIGNSTAFYQPSVGSQSLHLFANSLGIPDLTVTESRIGIQKSKGLTATLDVLGSVAVTGSLSTSGSFTVKSSGSNILVVSGSQGALLTINEKSSNDSRLFAVTSASINLLTVNDDKSTRISGSLIVTGSITGSLFGTSSFAISASNSIRSITSSYAITASFALNAGGGEGSGFPFSGSAVITGSLLVSGSTEKDLEIIGDSYFTGSLFIANNVVAAQITGSVKAVDDISARSVGGTSVRGLQSAINALSSRISAVVGPASAQPTRYVSVANTIANNVLTGISGLTVSVSAGVIYDIDGAIMYSVSAATGNAFGLIWPTANRVAGVWAGGISVNETGASTFSTMAFGNFDTGDSNSAVWSATVGAAGLHYIRIEGTIDAQTGGALYPLVRSSAAANTVVIARGSFFKLTRIN